MYLGMLRAWYEDRVPTKKQKTKEYQKKTKQKGLSNNYTYYVLANSTIFCFHPHDNLLYISTKTL